MRKHQQGGWGCKRRSRVQEHVELEYFFLIEHFQIRPHFTPARKWDFCDCELDCARVQTRNNALSTDSIRYAESFLKVVRDALWTHWTSVESGNAKASPSRIKQTRGWKRGGHREKELEEANQGPARIIHNSKLEISLVPSCRWLLGSSGNGRRQNCLCKQAYGHTTNQTNEGTLTGCISHPPTHDTCNGCDRFGRPANYMVNSFNTRPMCEANLFKVNYGSCCVRLSSSRGRKRSHLHTVIKKRRRKRYSYSSASFLTFLSSLLFFGAVPV